MITSRRKRWYYLLPLVAATTTTVGTLTAARPIGPNACSLAEDWVAAHRGSLPSTLAEFNQLSMNLRRHSYGRLTAAVRIRIWREKLDAYLNSTSGVNDGQRDFIRSVIAHLPEIVSDTTGTEGRRYVATNTLVEKGKEVFSETQFRDLFYTLGSPDRKAKAEAPESPFCECSTFSDGGECAGDPVDECLWGGLTCVNPVPACGFMGLDPCDGTCI